jgi:hypothetical protein
MLGTDVWYQAQKFSAKFSTAMPFLIENLSLYSTKNIEFTTLVSILTLIYCDMPENSNLGGFFIHQTI